MASKETLLAAVSKHAKKLQKVRGHIEIRPGLTSFFFAVLVASKDKGGTADMPECYMTRSPQLARVNTCTVFD